MKTCRAGQVPTTQMHIRGVSAWDDICSSATHDVITDAELNICSFFVKKKKKVPFFGIVKKA